MPELRASDCSCSRLFPGERKLQSIIIYMKQMPRLRWAMYRFNTGSSRLSAPEHCSTERFSMNFISRFAGKEGAEYEPEFLYESESADVPCT